MIYLVSQMALYLILAALAGAGFGWWSNHLRNKPQVTELLVSEDEDDFTIKNRLDQCFDDNTKLRRELKLSNLQLQKMNSKGNHSDNLGSNDSLVEKVKVLMDDLQLRDDTILVLEKELEVSRNNNA